MKEIGRKDKGKNKKIVFTKSNMKKNVKKKRICLNKTKNRKDNIRYRKR